MKILIAVPCMDQVAAPFAQSLAMLNKVGECAVGFQIGSLIYTARNEFSKQAITGNYDALMFFDSDMIFQPDTLEKMVAHVEAGKDIVTGLYFRRRNPFSPVLYKSLEYDKAKDESSWEDLMELPDTKDPFEVAGCGMGCCIITKAVLLDLLLNYRTWYSPFSVFGEDLAFCIRAREQGYKIWCDPTISLGHVGQLVINEQIWRANLSGEGTGPSLAEC